MSVLFLRKSNTLVLVPLLISTLLGCEEVPLQRGYRLFQRGNYPLAIQQWTYYLEHSEDRLENQEARAAAFLYRGLALSYQGHSELAICNYKEAVLRNPDCFYASYNLGVEYLYKGFFDEALATLWDAWRSIQKAGRGELEHSLLWNRHTLFRDRNYAFSYLGMLLLYKRDFACLRQLLHEMAPFVTSGSQVEIEYRQLEEFADNVNERTNSEAFFQRWLEKLRCNRRKLMK